MSLRPIEARDDAAIAALIREVMPSFGANGAGFAINDPEVDAMSRAYSGPRAGYWVVEQGGRVVGGGGFAPLQGGAVDTCELRKMYLLAEARGAGFGRELLLLCLSEAKRCGFRRMYLETLDTMVDARRLYDQNGFVRLPKPEGKTGHFGCNAWYAREL